MKGSTKKRKRKKTLVFFDVDRREGGKASTLLGEGVEGERESQGRSGSLFRKRGKLSEGKGSW